MAQFNAALTLIGGPTVLIELAGFRLLTDPTFDAPGHYESRGIVLEKTRGPAIGADAIGPLEAVLLSHDQHFDNLDRAGRIFLETTGPTFTTSAGAARLGPIARGLAPWETTSLTAASGARLFITATPARHGPPGIEPMTGDVIGFVLGLEQPGDAIYVSGDTVWYEGVAEIARRFRPRLVVLFAGAAKPRGPFHVTMDNNDVIETAHAFPQARIVAVHNDGWVHFTESQQDFVQALTTLGLAHRLTPLDLGRRAEFALA
ncbi:MAG TPA: MBL fold metallo-hydrolase [Acetobacteraceae bacterium]|nr:MBL fold metallo-hydrolase [Acetobacteraceae bacterium]